MSNRQISRHGRLLMVLMLMFSSILPGALHASTMAEFGAGSGSGHHATMHAAADQSTISHTHTTHMQIGAAEQPDPIDTGTLQDPCSPVVCSYALCSSTLDWQALFVPDSFEFVPMFSLIVANMVLPERPPRV